MCEGSFLPSSFGPHQKHTEFESSLRSYPISSSSAWVRFLFVTALLLRPATTAHVGPDALVRAGEPCSPTSCDAPHRWAGEGTRPYVTCPDDPLASATTTDISLAILTNPLRTGFCR